VKVLKGYTYEYIGKNPKKDFDAYNFLNAIK
jgi:hypothetical protein